jgi:hypothetical protein
MAIWYMLWPFGICYGHLVYVMAIWYMLWPFGNLVVLWYIFPRFGILCLEKSGNPASHNPLTCAQLTILAAYHNHPINHKPKPYKPTPCA